MRRAAIRLLTLGGAGIALAPAAAAQGGPPLGWSTSFDTLFLYQGDTDLSDAGSVSVNRGFLRGRALYTSDQGYSAGISLGYGRYFYNFDLPGAMPWDDVEDISLSFPVSFPINDRVNMFVVPSLRYDYESDAKASDGDTYGVFAGVTWKLSDRLTIGPGLGAFTQIEDDDLEVFPSLLIEWEIADRLSLSTLDAPGASLGPGLGLNYDVSDTLRIGLSARVQSTRFRLDDDGIAPGGVGEDTSLPVVVGMRYRPNPGMSLSAFVGADFDGELTLEDSNGNTVSKQDYDTAPIAGISFRLAF
ncbi:MAG: hypothetical protein AAGA05_06100 [Pseudomonadota bacterium]